MGKLLVILDSLLSSIFCVFLCFFLAFCSPSLVKFTRKELINIASLSAGTCLLVFTKPERYSESLVGGPAAVYGICWGEVRRSVHGAQTETGMLHSCLYTWQMSAPWQIRWMHYHFWTPRTQTSYWEQHTMADGFPAFQVDHVTELLGKMQGGTICLCINEGWCTGLTVLKKLCSLHLPSVSHTLSVPRRSSDAQCRENRFHSNLCISPACIWLNRWQRWRKNTTDSCCSSFSRILIYLTQKLPKYWKHIKCSTRDNNTLDHCYTVLKDVQCAVPRAASGLKMSRPVARTVRRWTNKTKKLHA